MSDSEKAVEKGKAETEAKCDDPAGKCPADENFTVKFITPGSDPVNSPNSTAGDQAQNEYTYSAANPGVLSMTLRAEVTPPDKVNIAEPRVKFTAEAIPKSELTYDGAGDGSATTINGKYLNVGVPSAATMIDTATVIVVGSVAPTTPPSILPSVVLKGAAVPGRRLVLADPSSGKSLAFSLDRVAPLVGAAPTVALGRLEGDASVLSLVWLNASLWPQGHRPDTFASDAVDSIVAFVRQVLGYSALAAKDPNAALSAALRDLEQGRAEAPLAWLEVAVERDLGPAAARQFADTAQAYLVSLAAPILLRLAGGPAGERVKPALRAMLTARGANVDRGADAPAMQKAWRSLPADVRRGEARRLLGLFDSPWPTLNGARADATLELVVGRRPPENTPALPPARRKALWTSEIESILD